MRITLALLVLALASACSGSSANRPRPSHPSAGGAAEAPVELALRRADGRFIDVGELRGAVVVLFVFATFDTLSQVTLTPLSEVARAHPDVRFIGIAAQPSARLLVEGYERALAPPFPITYDPQETVAAGESMLGEILSVPTLIVLDRRGLEVARHVGFADEARIAALLAAAGVSAP